MVGDFTQGMAQGSVIPLRQTLMAGCVLLLVVLGGACEPGRAVGAGASDQLREAKQAVGARQFDRALTLVEPLLKDEHGALEARQLKVSALAGLNRSQDALAEYERVSAKLGHEDPPLLREVLLAFIRPLLKDMREQMRGAAYTALKEFDAEEAVTLFEDGLTDGSGLVRALAVEGLGRAKGGVKSPRLRKALEDEAAMVRTNALKALGRSGDPAALVLIERALTDEQPMVRIAALGAQVLLGRKESVSKIRDAAQRASSPEERGAALRWLSDLHDRETLALSQRALADRQPSVRGAAAIALGELKISEAETALVGSLNDPVPPVKAAAAIGLGEFTGAESASALSRLLKDGNPAVRAGAIGSLLAREVPYDDLSAVILDMTRQSDVGIRSVVARALGRAKGRNIEPALSVLSLLLKDSISRPRIVAARMLGQLDTGDQSTKKERVAVLKAALRDQDEAVRATAAGALGRVIAGSRGRSSLDDVQDDR
jgi:HEAT repeat protein